MRSRVLETCGIVRVQTWQSQVDVPSKAARWLGLAWPEKACTLANGRADVLCIGPTDWLVVAPDPDVTGLLQTLDVVFEGDSFRATDVTQALARVEIEGAECARSWLRDARSICIPPVIRPDTVRARALVACRSLFAVSGRLSSSASLHRATGIIWFRGMRTLP
jgi:sarcosine oxidase gamma subunit